MNHDLDGQVAVVTGGNGGIGLGFAEGVAMAGDRSVGFHTGDSVVFDGGYTIF